jgi:aspartate/glutamate racemase
MTKAPRIALISVHPIAMQPPEDAFKRLWPEADRAPILDESLFHDRGKAGVLTKPLSDRIVALAEYAKLCGADGILFTCSAFGEAIESVQRTYSMPVLKPNEAMFEAALEAGRKVGMLASAPFAVAGLEQEFRELAEKKRPDAVIKTHCVPEAMHALTRGDAAEHNRLLAEAAHNLADCDVIILAHFSTSRAEDAVAARVKVPVLTAPGAAVTKLKRLLAHQGRAA